MMNIRPIKCEKCGKKLSLFEGNICLECEEKAIQALDQELFGMRDATKEESESVNNYIKSISEPTGIKFLYKGEHITREERREAIEYLKKYRELDERLYQTAPFTSVSHNALVKCLRHWDTAIQALEQEPSGETVSLEVFKQVMRERDIAIEQLKELGYDFGQKIEPCGDAISRQAVIDILEKEGHKWGNDYRDWVDAVKDVETLPPVAPQPKMGHPQKSCDTCEHSDEMDGSNCYECIKGMRDRYDSQPICEEREKGECPYYAG